MEHTDDGDGGLSAGNQTEPGHGRRAGEIRHDFFAGRQKRVTRDLAGAAFMLVPQGRVLAGVRTEAFGALIPPRLCPWPTLRSGWSTTGMTEDILADDGVIQTVEAKVPVAPDAKKFLRLEVARP